MIQSTSNYIEANIDNNLQLPKYREKNQRFSIIMQSN